MELCQPFLVFLRPGLDALAFLLRAMAIACCRLVTTGPPLPLCSSPLLYSCIVDFTAFCPLVGRLAMGHQHLQEFSLLRWLQCGQAPSSAR